MGSKSSSAVDKEAALSPTPHSKRSDTLFINALLVDQEGVFEVLISRTKILSIKSTSNSTQTSPQPDTVEVIDLKSKNFICPSLVDNHVHFSAWTLNQSRLDLREAKSARNVVELVQKRAEEEELRRPVEPLVGRDFRVGEWPDIEAMTKETLDAALPHRAVALISGDLHSMWLNTLGLRFVGEDPNSSNGVLLEKKAFNALNKLNDIPAGTLDELAATAAKAAASRGVTEIVELEMTHNIKVWKRRVAEKGLNTLRVRLGMYEEHVHDAVDAGLKSGDLLEGGQGLLTIGPYKIITDGSLGARTAFCCDPYPGTHDYGLFIYPQKTLKEMLEFATTHHLVLAVHAIGDAANTKTLETFASLSSPSLPGSTIEHAQLLLSDDIPKFKNLNLIASVQPEHLNDDKYLADRFWEGRTERAFAYKSLVDAGVTIKLGSDAPVAPLEPWGSMAAAVARERSGEEGLGAWHPEQRLTNREAFEASTWTGKASIEVGRKADLCVVEKDPLKCSAKEMREMSVLGTMLDGRWTYRRDEF